MPNERVELPREHWVEVRDPWDITEDERNALWADLARQSRSRQPSPAPGGDLAPPPSIADVDPEKEIRSRSENGRRLMAMLFVKWGGPLLDDRPLTIEEIAKVPVPLFNALDAVVMPAVRELFPFLGGARETSPTTP